MSGKYPMKIEFLLRRAIKSTWKSMIFSRFRQRKGEAMYVEVLRKSEFL